MQKRYGEEFEFMLNGDKTEDTVRAWTKKLFHENGTKNFKVPRGVYEWFLEVVFCAYGKAETDLIKRMILVKIIHTREVVMAGIDITSFEKGFDWNDYQVGMVCLLHDIGRFDQALLGSFSDIKTGFDHALMGSEMVKNHEFMEFEVVGINKKSVVESVRHHSAFSYQGDDVYAKLTRDADKLALLRTMPEILAVKVEEYSNNGVTEEALRAYKAGTMVRNEDINTKADLLLAWLGWESDFNFSKTESCFVSEGIKEWMMGEVALLGVMV
ncbi:hypothetical protein COW83_05305 [Candidatus Collierbacteria bacterium CG22_combo_CG10-13_8_21_14_all_43_12]|uniref:HD domain-containing protein n=1 Tax=Candidatus Collierbacteria bacterium CG22_combo_CG10-13_8_21_14_all_43_12 TaxID=1974537 RepID=A0A2H0DSR5_9BACT|nr:MAG: hypothetical protein COW83_05305 [Candidatus Collierbacteria bacterium CG22_combo_CG10-13_8_21_14_all_43_12]